MFYEGSEKASVVKNEGSQKYPPFVLTYHPHYINKFQASDLDGCRLVIVIPNARP